MMSYEKAGNVAAEVLAYGTELVKVGTKLSEATEKIEKKIDSLKAKPAFPPQFSLNEIAAHNYSDNKDETEFKKGDLVKLDVGIHVDGLIADTATTIDLGDNTELVQASKEALDEALKLFTPGTKLNEIGKKIEEVITSYGFNPIKNLSGHEIKPFELHAGLTVPNYDNGDETIIKEGQVFAVEPFATTGEGFVKDGGLSGIYSLINPKNVRSGREVLNFIMNNFQTLPFHKKYLFKKFQEFKASFGLRILEKEEIIHQYAQLVEKTNGLVSQAEHTVIVKDKPVITTKA
jgi:methionyl aminopeptidase